MTVAIAMITNMITNDKLLDDYENQKVSIIAFIMWFLQINRLDRISS